jgi:cell division inhibitor SepF
VSNSFRKVLVYFGLAEDREYYEDDEPDVPEPEREMESRYQERPNVRRLQSRRRRDEIDDIFGDDLPSERRTAHLRPVASRNPNGREELRVHIVVPHSFNDAKDVGDKFKDSIPVIVNLQSVDSALAVRFVDFTSGLIYALDGGMQRIADKVFLLTPRNVEVSAEERAALIEKGFFNQS